MRAHVQNHPVCLASDGRHNAFTDLCQWRGTWYCAYRVAQTHGITPPGTLAVQGCHPHDPADWQQVGRLALDGADLRDPKFVPSDEALYLFCGAYLPHPAHRTFQGLSAYPGDNLIQTMLTYTADGQAWAPLTPILRSQYWGWSVVVTENAYWLAAYHTGRATESASIVLWNGRSLFDLSPYATIYDGADNTMDGGTHRYASWSPSEPVLYVPAPETLACCLRTTGVMALGVSRAPYQDWRWHVRQDTLHPSAVLATQHGRLLAARELRGMETSRRAQTARPRRTLPPAAPEITTALFQLQGQRVTRLLTLESAGDTGYAGLAHGPDPDTVLVSYYSSHEYIRQGCFGVTLPSSNVYVATVRLAS